MKKEKIEKFISKYYLGGNIESVKFEINEKKLKTKFQTEDKTLLGIVLIDDFDLEDSEFGIFDTSEFQKILGAMEDEININLNIIDNRLVSIKLTDTQLKTIYVITDPEIVPKASSLKKLPDFEVEMDVTEEFVSNFLKGKSALSDSKNVALNTLTDELEFIINYSEINTSRISFKEKAKIDGSINYISFNSDYLKAILVANKDSKSAKMKISSKGLMELEFKGDGFFSKYYLVQLQYS